MTYEIKIEIIDERYLDTLLVSLARQGYAPYYNHEYRALYFTAYDTDMTEIKE